MSSSRFLLKICILLSFYLTICSGQEFARGACPEVTPPEEGSRWNLSKVSGILGFFRFENIWQVKIHRFKSPCYSLDFQYLGLWYEIARTENIWEIGLKCVTANYTLRPDGIIRVDNKGITER